jgi:hypothetical protein
MVAYPVRPAPWEAEIGRISIQGQPRQGVCKTPSQPIAGHGSVHLSSQPMQEAEICRITFLGQPGQKSLQDAISMGKSWAWWCTSVTADTVGCLN